MTEQRTDYDSPWFEVIESFFPQFLEFFFPDAYAVIDWTRQPEFLDKELQQLEPDAEIGKRLVDKVAKVWHLKAKRLGYWFMWKSKDSTTRSLPNGCTHTIIVCSIAIKSE